MPSFRTATVASVLSARPGLQRITVVLDEGLEPERAYVLTQLLPKARAGDRVVVNTTAVELGLGTGGWHVVHWNLSHDFAGESLGHVMKARYTPVQTDVDAPGAALVDLGGMPVVVVELHSQLAAVAVAFGNGRPRGRLAYVMTDQAALPIALSDLVYELRSRSLLSFTITSGQAFGGDGEAVSIYDALAVAHERADAVVVAPGPGSVGTGTALGFSALELGAVLDAAGALGGRAIAGVRASQADPRERHRGISHHTETLLTVGTQRRATVAVPNSLAVPATISARHDIVTLDPPAVVELMRGAGLDVESMGRPAADDPLLFECAAAAGNLAAQHIT